MKKKDSHINFITRTTEMFIRKDVRTPLKPGIGRFMIGKSVYSGQYKQEHKHGKKDKEYIIENFFSFILE